MNVSCRRCGTCCVVNVAAFVADEDLARWQRQGREDILHVLDRQRAVWAGDRLVSRQNGHDLVGCPFLKREGPCFACAIYETRPQVCRDFSPGSSEVCPQFIPPGDISRSTRCSG